MIFFDKIFYSISLMSFITIYQIYMDQNTKRFYLEMGYDEQKIIKSFQYSKKSGMDMLDVLNMPIIPSINEQKQNKKQQMNRNKEDKQGTTFLTPINLIKMNDYQLLYSKNKSDQLKKIELRQQNNPVGLLNVSNCCYLNSLIQCYFLLQNLKQQILKAQPLDNLQVVLAKQSKTKIKRIQGQYKMIQKLKQFFTTLHFTSKKYVDPTSVLQNLIGSFGEKIQYGQQKDLSQINYMIIQRLSEGLTYTKQYYKNQFDFFQGNQSNNIKNSIFMPEKGGIKQLFYGTKVQYYQQQKQQLQPITSDFAGIILNPRARNVSNALDQQFNFQVQIQGKTQKKRVYIRDEPQYLFLYINRTQYDVQQQQALKNNQKISFDFDLYMDQYIQKYKHQTLKNKQKLSYLLKQKNKIKQQINSLQILQKKVDQCYKYTNDLQGWNQKFPSQDQFDQQFQQLSQKIQKIQEQLDIVQSRKQHYHLMYIFVHRGDAVSGHYWGYGRNEQNWYRFDINTKIIEQKNILIDIQKSSATPYCLLYVKNDKLPNFKYKYYLNSQLIDLKIQKYLNKSYLEQILVQNNNIHKNFQQRSNHLILKRTLDEYTERLTKIIKIYKNYQANKSKYFDKIQIYNNFTLFLISKKQKDLVHFNIFEQSIYLASGYKINTTKLLHQLDLLTKIQSNFKKHFKKQYQLKHFSLFNKQLEKYISLYQQYNIGVAQLCWLRGTIIQIQKLIDNINKEIQHKIQPNFSQKNIQVIKKIIKFLFTRKQFSKSQKYLKAINLFQKSIYLTQINDQISRLILLYLALLGIKIENIDQLIQSNSIVDLQIKKINQINKYTISLQIKQNNQDKAITNMVNIVDHFQNQSLIKNRNNSAIKQTKQKINSQKQILSPSKISKQFNKKQQYQTHCISGVQKIQLLIFKKQMWKIQELEGIKVNYQITESILNILKKLEKIKNIYTSISKRKEILQFQDFKIFGIAIQVAIKQQQNLI